MWKGFRVLGFRVQGTGFYSFRVLEKGLVTRFGLMWKGFRVFEVSSLPPHFPPPRPPTHQPALISCPPLPPACPPLLPPCPHLLQLLVAHFDGQAADTLLDELVEVKALSGDGWGAAAAAAAGQGGGLGGGGWGVCAGIQPTRRSTWPVTVA